MFNFLCRWPNGDLSIVSAHDRNEAIIILDEIGDATEAELFETNNLFINFTLTDPGHLEFENFAESFDADVMEKCYPLILKAQMEDEDETEDYTQAVIAERLRLGQVQVQETDELAKICSLPAWLRTMLSTSPPQSRHISNNCRYLIALGTI